MPPDLSPPPQEEIDRNVYLALYEDLDTGDLSAAAVPTQTLATATIFCREHAVLCGRPWCDNVFAHLDRKVSVNWRYQDGDDVAAETILCELQGPARALLAGERTALNFMQTLSATATTTRQLAERLDGSATRLLDTRKTLPGLRQAQKYAVRCGGGQNHRMGLFDGVLLKENHIAAAGGIGAAVAAVRRAYTGVEIEVEVESMQELDLALAARADIIMLDNFSLTEVDRAVAHVAGRARLEASGGFGIDDLIALAATGVDYVSVGALTKHVRAIDLSMRIQVHD